MSLRSELGLTQARLTQKKSHCCGRLGVEMGAHAVR
jgi:hypothetical protein